MRREFHWGPGLFLIIYHTILAIALPLYLYYFTPSWQILTTAVILYFITGISITGGYHRLYSHRAYKTTPLIESLFLFFATLSGQGSALRWSFDHRLHHAHVDTDRDPYSINKGFWYAHMLWLFEKPLPIDPKVVPDLLNNKRIVFQHTFYRTLFITSNLLVFLLFGWLLNDYLASFVFVWWVRLFALHHSTWFINSLAHTWGDKPFSQEQSAVNNYILSFLTFGEGYHNYHHTFANDYRNGIRWYHFDPTKWTIWLLHRIGLAFDLRKVSEKTINQRMVLESKSLLMNKLKEIWYIKKDELETKIHSLSDQMLEKIGQFNHLRDTYYEFKKQCAEKTTLLKIKYEMKALRASLHDDWRHWKNLSKHILNLQPLLGI